jgi:putative hydrolase of the HAD superfamily
LIVGSSTHGGARTGPRTDARTDARTVWLFDLDNTLHDAGAFVFPALKTSMRGYIQQQLQVDAAEAQRLSLHYWTRYGATLLGLVRHHGVDAAHFLHAHLFEAVFAIEDMAMFGQLRPKPDARMLRRIAVRLKVPAHRCVLVEDTLVHQKAARSVGMGTVWMQRFARRLQPGVAAAPRWSMQPAYVDRRVRRLRQLQR